MKLGSLFDGIAGFPLAGVLSGIEPVWASEIEPFPIRVSKARFPSMKHLGSVTDINGAEIEPVDIITFGSPCQDLSVAGKQLGMKCSKCPLFHSWNNESDKGESCGLFGDGWDNDLQYEDGAHGLPGPRTSRERR